MKHKLQRLDEAQLKQLRAEILVHRIRKLDDFGDLLPINKSTMAGGASPQFGRGGREAQDLKDKAAAQEIEKIIMPDKMFVLSRERLRPYQRLDKKFQGLFDCAYQELKKFKDAEIINFGRTT